MAGHELILYALPDEDLGEEEDRDLRALLALCFTKSGDEVFLRRRYFLEPPEERWFIREQSGALVAHAGLRHRPVRSGRRDFWIGGISEVCVHPRHRGRGYVRRMLDDIHSRLRSCSVYFSLLFGDEGVYASSGYRRAKNVFRFWNPETLRWIEEPVPEALVRELSSARWPRAPVDLRGILY